MDHVLEAVVVVGEGEMVEVKERGAVGENGRLEVIEVVGAAILRPDGTCLVAQRSEAMASPLKWEFPGGKVEPMESAPEALRREIAEELGLEIEPVGRLGVGEAGAGSRLIRLEVWEARLLGGQLVLADHRQARWVEPSELGALDWAEADVPVLGAVRRAMEAARRSG